MPIDLSEARNVTSKHEYDSLVREYRTNPDITVRTTTSRSQEKYELCIAYHKETVFTTHFLLIKEK